MTWLKEFGIGLGLGCGAFGYAIVALATGRTFLPGLPGNTHTVGGPSGTALAFAYLLGGAYLFARHFLQRRLSPGGPTAALYALQNALLAGFIGSLIYVLLYVERVE